MKTFKNLKVGDNVYYVDPAGNFTSGAVLDITKSEDGLYYFETTYNKFKMKDESMYKDIVTLQDCSGGNDRFNGTKVFTVMCTALDYRDDILMEYFETGYNNMVKEKDDDVPGRLTEQEESKEPDDETSFFNDMLNTPKEGFQYSTTEFISLLDKYFGNPDDEEVDELEYEGVNMLNAMSGYEVFYHCSLINQLTRFLDLFSTGLNEDEDNEEDENEDDTDDSIEFIPDSAFTDRLNVHEGNLIYGDENQGCEMNCHECPNEKTCLFYSNMPADTCKTITADTPDIPNGNEMVLAITITDRGKDKLRKMNPILTEDDTCNPLCMFNSKHIFFPIRVPEFTKIKIESEDPDVDHDLIDKAVDNVYKKVENWIYEKYPELEMLEYETEWRCGILDTNDFEVCPEITVNAC